MASSVTVPAFVEVLEHLVHTTTGYRKISFQKAIHQLKGKETITIDEAKKLPGIGSGIIKRMIEFQETGTLQELPQDIINKNAVLTLFEGIHGVGPVLANKWYEKGYRTLKDIPIDSLSASQKLGYQYYSEINSRIPYDEILCISQYLERKVKEYNEIYRINLKATICGSFLRRKETSGDIDIVITADDLRHINKFIKFTGLIKHILSQGSTKILCLGGLENVRRIDFEITEQQSYYYSLLYFTGSKEFNVKMRGIAKSKGFLLNQDGLFDEKISVAVKNEKEIFDFLDMEYIPPHLR